MTCSRDTSTTTTTIKATGLCRCNGQWRSLPELQRQHFPLLLGSSDVLRSLSHYMAAQSQGYHTINYLEDLEVMTEEATDGLSRESTIVNQPNTETEFH